MNSEEETIPLDETLVERVELCGRLFQHHALEQRIYYAPIDEEEIKRLETMHSVLSIMFDNKLIFPPVHAPARILECGFGAGDWAIQAAKHFPESKVLGIDISPHMIPENTPDNLELQIDDLNSPFTFESNHFDFVHSQMMAGGIDANRWRDYMQDIYRVLRPGGWCQMIEVYFNAQSFNGTLSREHALSRWSREYLEAMHPEKDPRAALRMADWMANAGFTEIESKLMTLPMCGWSKDPREKAIGNINRDNVAQLLYSMGLYPFTHFQRMAFEDFELLVSQAIEEANDPSIKAYFPLYVFIGRKPAELINRQSFDPDSERQGQGGSTVGGLVPLGWRSAGI